MGFTSDAPNMDAFAEVEKQFPAKRVTATAYRSDGSSVNFANSDALGSTGAALRVYLDAEEPLQVGDEYVRVRLCADPTLSRVLLYWKAIDK